MCALSFMSVENLVSFSSRTMTMLSSLNCWNSSP
ncbi:Uncharacterised protein [Mycobacteroides abscessus subsp. abscessus]|nr:Uncharacterised protein [Mycobacteroides abscessus subsp. abscessus]SKS18588.1 Uncharacterised protein [Mycobacteroides abscessus subsp. abscessus]SKT36736.1 Uncharacterised protein [Mycobacteroides abscessus subsp. abscessus]